MIEETRFLIIPKNEKRFEKIVSNLFPRDGEDYRIDWYFSNYRIRFSYGSFNGWKKIMNSSAGKIKKDKINLPNMFDKIRELDKVCLFKIKVDSKRPRYDGEELYLEKVTIYRNNRTKIFYTTEAENQKEYNNILDHKKVPELKYEIKEIVPKGPMDLRNLVLEILKE